jgi:sensor histidine kinase YesM
MKKSVIILLHMGYWMLYLLLLALILVCLRVGTNLKTQPFFINFKFDIFLSAFAVVPAIIGFYSYYSLLFAKYLTRKKIWSFFTAAVVAALLGGITGAVILMFLYELQVGPGISHDGGSSVIAITLVMAVIALLNGVVGLVMKGFITWYGDIKLKEELSKKNFETELALVKSQINPHFLFNTINNIDILIEKNSAQASAYLNKLSDIMRFMLYETKTTKIPLQKELSYIEKYIQLQLLRTVNQQNVSYAVQGDATQAMIHPMLFIPFIENAFKHNSDIKADNAIEIMFAIDNNTITFTCKNTCSMQKNIENNYSGLGNELIQKRLTLLYGPKHQLHINQLPESYHLTLTIQLQND